MGWKHRTTQWGRHLLLLPHCGPDQCSILFGGLFTKLVLSACLEHPPPSLARLVYCLKMHCWEIRIIPWSQTLGLSNAFPDRQEMGHTKRCAWASITIIILKNRVPIVKLKLGKLMCQMGVILQCRTLLVPQPRRFPLRLTLPRRIIFRPTLHRHPHPI